jgi:cytochrome c-type biogenesis protein CcmF
VALLVWLIAASYRDLSRRVRHKGWLRGLRQLNPGYYGMLLAHLGVGVTAVGIAVVSTHEANYDIRMAPGDNLQVEQYEFIFNGTQNIVGPNYTSVQGIVKVNQEGEFYTYLYPEKRSYTARQQVMTEAAIDAALSRDIYVAMGEPLADDAWAMRIHFKPMVRWIWLGGILMSLGAVLAVWDKRYRRRRAQ